MGIEGWAKYAMSREGRGLRAPWVDNSGKGQTEVILKEPESLTQSLLGSLGGRRKKYGHCGYVSFGEIYRMFLRSHS